MNNQALASESSEMYLKSIYELSTLDPVVPISVMAERLGISAVSANEMIHRMVERNWVRHQRYKGVELTEEGRRRALSVIRRHRLWEFFLCDRLGLPWEEVHDVACELEHSVRSEVSEALAAYLRQPQACPHGNPIPPNDGQSATPPEATVSDLLQGDKALIRRIQPESGPVLTHLANLGLRPGVSLVVEDVDPIDGLRTLNAGGRRVVIGQSAAKHVLVEGASGFPAGGGAG